MKPIIDASLVALVGILVYFSWTHTTQKDFSSMQWQDKIQRAQNLERLRNGIRRNLMDQQGGIAYEPVRSLSCDSSHSFTFRNDGQNQVRMNFPKKFYENSTNFVEVVRDDCRDVGPGASCQVTLKATCDDKTAQPFLSFSKAIFVWPMEFSVEELKTSEIKTQTLGVFVQAN